MTSTQQRAGTPHLLRAAFEQAPMGVAVLDGDLRYLAINEPLARINELPVAAHLGRAVAEVLPAIWPTLEPLLRRALSGEPVRYAWESATAAGLSAAARALLQPVLGDGGEVEGVVVLVEDTTLEARHHHRTERLRDLSNSLAGLTSWLAIPSLLGTALRSDSGVALVRLSIPDEATHSLLTIVTQADGDGWRDEPLVSEDMDGGSPTAQAFRRGHVELLGPRSGGATHDERALPLVVAGRTVGAISVGWPHDARPDSDQLAFVDLVTLRAAVAVERLVSSAREERAAQRAAALLRTATHLNTVREPVSVAAEVVRCVGEQTGATGVGVFLLDETRRRLRRVHAAPLDDPRRYQRFDDVPLEEELPVTVAVRESRSVWLESSADWAQYAPVAATGESLGWPAVAVVPLTSGPDEAVSGSLYAHFQSPRRLTAEDRQFLTTVAALAASTFDRIRSDSAQEQARSRLADRELRLQRFAESRACGILEVNDTHITAANQAFLDMLGYDVLPEGGLDWRAITPPGWEQVDVAGLAALHQQGVAPPFTKEYYRADGSVVPVLISVAAVRETPFEGVATVVDLSEQRQAERRQVAEVAARERLTAAVQTALFPQLAVSGDRFEVRVAYRAGDERLALGGDFYDACSDRDGRLGVVIGDVTGHGPDAAACGAALRAAWRALTITGMPLAQLYSALDAVLVSERPPEEDGLSLATLLAAQIDPDGEVSMLVAGHPEPLLWTGRTAEPLPVQRCGMLGVGVAGEPRLTRMRLAPDQTLVLYTDGLIEGRAQPGSVLRLDSSGLATVLRGMDPDGPLEPIIERVAELHGGPLRDDAAIVAVRLRG
ncbi:MAG TPA: SpoIIE family protein phosphatase [Candidatus Nanopelagicales bacterium]|nr:SpoIIE family protein phosphatase [Candidatus Nanopelagicales bacterium]